MSADRYEWLASLKPNSFSLGMNDQHAPNYMSAGEWIADNKDDFKEVSDAELRLMVETNTIWSLQIYPDTPIGFYVWYGATLDSVIDQARSHLTSPQRQGDK